MRPIGHRASPVLALAFAAALTAVSLPQPAAAKPTFAPAQTVPEQALARILKADAADPNAVDPTGGRAGRRPRTTPPPGAAYLKYLTVPVATAMLVDEAHQVKTNCGGVYKAGEECGMGSDPVSCGQDFPDSYLFRTLQSGPGLAVVEAAWPPDHPGAQPSPSATYRLKPKGGVWQIDGVSCAGGGGDYNWPGR